MLDTYDLLAFYLTKSKFTKLLHSVLLRLFFFTDQLTFTLAKIVDLRGLTGEKLK